MSVETINLKIEFLLITIGGNNDGLIQTERFNLSVEILNLKIEFSPKENWWEQLLAKFEKSSTSKAFEHGVTVFNFWPSGNEREQ